MNLEPLPAATVLALPVVTLEDLLMQPGVGIRFESDAGSLGSDRLHEAFS